MGMRIGKGAQKVRDRRLTGMTDDVMRGMSGREHQEAGKKVYGSQGSGKKAVVERTYTWAGIGTPGARRVL
jgi:hypothetical protein